MKGSVCGSMRDKTVGFWTFFIKSNLDPPALAPNPFAADPVTANYAAPPPASDAAPSAVPAQPCPAALPISISMFSTY